MKGKNKKYKKTIIQPYWNPIDQQSISGSSEKDRLAFARQELEQLNFDQMFISSHLQQGVEIKIDDWNHDIRKKNQENKVIMSLGKPKTLQNELSDSKKQKININTLQTEKNSHLRSDEKVDERYKKPQLSFRSIVPLNLNNNKRTPIKRSNEDKIESVKRIMTKSALDCDKSFKKHLRSSGVRNSKAIDRLMPEEKNFVYGQKYHFISFDSKTIEDSNRGKTKDVLKKNIQISKYSKRLSQKSHTQRQKSEKQKIQKKQCESWLRRGKLGREFRRLVQLIEEEGHTKINFKIKGQ